MLVWDEIPTRCLSEAVTQGLKQAGSFLCSAGTVAKAWADPKAKLLELGQSKDSGAKALEHAREWEKNWDMMTEEEQKQAQDEHRTFFSGLRARLAAGSEA